MDLIIHPAPGDLESLTRRNIPSDDPAVARRVAEIVEAVRTGGIPPCGVLPSRLTVWS